jgi:hypothetical protein
MSWDWVGFFVRSEGKTVQRSRAEKGLLSPTLSSKEERETTFAG